MHQAPARPPPRFNRAPNNEAGTPPTSTPDSDRGPLRQNPSTNAARGGRGRYQPHHPRPVNARPATPPQPGAQPVSSSPLMHGTAPLVVRGNGHRPQGLGQTNILARQAASSSATRVSVPLTTGGGTGIEARAMELRPQGSYASTPSQAPGHAEGGVRQPARRPLKPPRPPGPPPPHILLEQQKRREMVALQKAQQSASNTEGGTNRDSEGSACLASARAAQNNERGKNTAVLPHTNNAGSILREGDRAGGSMHLMPAGAATVTGESSGKAHQSLTARSKWQPSASCQDAAYFARREGDSSRATILTSPTVGPLALAPLGRSSFDNATPTEWQEFWDDEVEASYFFNCVTREAQWVRPDGF